MNRHTRRSQLHAFRREVHHCFITHLIAADEPLDDHPLLHRARNWWCHTLREHRPSCIRCRANFADDAIAGAFLFGAPSDASKSCAVAVFCRYCWNAMPPELIEAEATRVLQQAIPGGSFLDDETRL